MTRQHRMRGFTLLEVLVALAILGTALAATSGSTRSAAKQQAHREDAVLAHWVASNVATELLINPGNVADDMPPREIALYGRDFSATISTQRDDEDRPVSHTVEVAARVAPHVLLHALLVPLVSEAPLDEDGTEAPVDGAIDPDRRLLPDASP